MTQQEITLLNLGESLDNLANLDPRGYGVCKLLYKAAREFTKEPLCVNAAKKLCQTLKAGDTVFIMTGFVLMPFRKAETDGIISSVLLASALVKAFKAKPIIICPEENITAVEALSKLLGLKLNETIECFTFTKDASKAERCADDILSCVAPKAVISIECAGANEKGVYHNSSGIDVTEVEAKQDILFEKLKDLGVLNIAIGDLGNEIGMGAIGEFIKKNIPYAAEGSCNCSCGGGLLAKTKADNLITATVSDWGCYSLIAMLAFIFADPEIMHGAETEKAAMITAAESGMIDMSGKAIPAIDGFGTEITCGVTELMKELVKSTLNLKEECKLRFDKIIELKSFE